MAARDPVTWMWLEACDLVERAERLHRQFFQPGLSTARGPTWGPPVDLFETERGLFVLVALPGVTPGQIRVGIEEGTLLIAGERPLPLEARAGTIHRLEIPYGRFERRIELPPGRYEFDRHEVNHGCLVLRLLRLA
jgi:HSP20 family protein